MQIQAFPESLTWTNLKESQMNASLSQIFEDCSFKSR